MVRVFNRSCQDLSFSGKDNKMSFVIRTRENKKIAASKMSEKK